MKFFTTAVIVLFSLRVSFASTSSTVSYDNEEKIENNNNYYYNLSSEEDEYQNHQSSEGGSDIFSNEAFTQILNEFQSRIDKGDQSMSDILSSINMDEINRMIKELKGGRRRNDEL